MPVRFKKFGFTLVELLVVLAVAGVLISITIPAIQSARDASRRVKCTDNMKQMAIAAHKYYDAKNELPYFTGINRRFSMNGYNSTNIGYSVHAALLPYLEHADLFATFANSYEEKSTKLWVWLGFIEDASQQAARTNIPLFRCPSDINAVEHSIDLVVKAGHCGDGRESPVASGNYVVCNGSGTGYNYDHTVLNDGIVSKKTPRTYEMIPDGLANTLFFSEAIIGDASRFNNTPPDFSTPYLRTATLESSKITYRGQEDWLAEIPGMEGVLADDSFDLPSHIVNNVDHWYGLRGFSWMIGDSYATGFTAFSTPNPPHADWCDPMGIGFFAARSFHSGGVNVVNADGSATFVTNSINRQTWHKLGARNDNR